MKLFQDLISKLAVQRRNKNMRNAEILELFPFDGPVYVVGDLHGCLAAYLHLESLILKDAETYPTQPTIILLGDIVDRGPQTAALIDHVLSRQRAGSRTICLMGNHEAMMLEFLANPDSNMSWLEFGGFETLASYGIDTGGLTRMSARKLAQLLSAHIPQNHITFLQNTLLGLQVGRFFLAHAGADCAKPLTSQPINALLWGSAGQIPPQDLIMVHGHFVVDEPKVSARCVSIDTGAYMNGRLTCLRLLPTGQPAILTLTVGDVFKDLVGVQL